MVLNVTYSRLKAFFKAFKQYYRQLLELLEAEQSAFKTHQPHDLTVFIPDKLRLFQKIVTSQQQFYLDNNIESDQQLEQVIEQIIASQPSSLQDELSIEWVALKARLQCCHNLGLKNGRSSDTSKLVTKTVLSMLQD